MASYRSPFPAGFLGVDLNYDGVWNPLGDDLKSDGVTVKHGGSSEGSGMDVSELGFIVKNGDGKYNPRNPSSPLSGKIGKNTPARATAALGAPWLNIESGTGSQIADSAALSPTGDIDLRWWGDAAHGQVSTNLITKWSNSSNQKTYAMTTDTNGRIVLYYSQDGATTLLQQSTAPVPAWAGPIALRATLDVNNGAGGHTITFYYATNLDSTWYRLGAPVVVAGTVSLFDGTAPVYISNSLASTMRVYGYEIRHSTGSTYPVSSFRFDRAVPGRSRETSSRRTNLFFDGRARGSYALGAQGGTFQRSNGEFVLTKTAAAGTAAYGALRGVAPYVLVSQVHTVRFDYKFSGGVQVFYRPGDSITSTTGQVNLTSTLGLIQDGQWHTTSATFTTTSTTPGANGAGIVLQHATATLPGVEARVRNVIIRNSARTTTQMGETFDGWDTNTPDRFYYWAVEPYASPAVEYAGLDWSYFADDQGRYWTGVTGTSVTNRHTLATGEVAEFPVDWNTKGEPSVMTAITASGVSRRLGQGQRVLNSPLYNSIMGLQSPDLLAYWPMEDGDAATEFGAAVGRFSAKFNGGTMKPGSFSDFKGSKPVATLGASSITAQVRQPASTGAIQVRSLLYVPSGITGTRTLYELKFNGGDSVNAIDRLQVRLESGGALGVRAWNFEGDLINDPGLVGFNVNARRVRLSVSIRQIGGSSVEVKLTTLEEGGSGLTYTYPTWTTRGLRAIQNVKINPFNLTEFNDVAIGHLTVDSSISSIYDLGSGTSGPMVAYAGETAEARIRRLVTERSDTPLVFIGSTASTVGVGPQPIASWLDIMRDLEKADGGVLVDDPGSVGFRYRTLHSMSGQPPAAVIPYEDNKVIPFLPVDDDARTVNSFTATRTEGASFTAVQETGPLSILPPPLGVDLYEGGDEYNVSTDAWAQRWSTWGLHIGTNDEARYPTLGVDLADPRLLADPVLTRSLLSLKVGDRLMVTNPPPWLTPRSVDVLVMGIRMAVGTHSFRLEWTCIPARPYRVGYFNAGHRYSGEGTVTTSLMASNATNFVITPPSGVYWTVVDGSYDIVINGEVMTVTNVVGNTMSVIRSVNGVVKSHPAGSAVALADPSYYAR